VPTILFSQLPDGHVAIVIAERVGDRHVVEVYLKLVDVPDQGSGTAKPGRTFRVSATVADSGGTVIDAARRGADSANGEVAAHDPHTFAPFPGDEDIARYRVPGLRPALAAGRELVDLMRESQVPGVADSVRRLVESSRPLRYQETFIEKLGVESDLVAFLEDEDGFGVRARVELKAAVPADALPAGDSIDAVVMARVYDAVNDYGLPSTPFAEGPEVECTLCMGVPRIVDLRLPVVPSRPDAYYVVAKVLSTDARYRAAFDPSDCYARTIELSSVSQR
jgi:hypothetical protein